MKDGSSKTAIVVGVVAAAAGVAIASYVYAVRLREAAAEQEHTPKPVADVLDECFAKLRDLQHNVEDLHAPALRPAQKKS